MTDTRKLRATPETDDQAFRPCKHCVDEKINCVSADFARKLERQRDELAEALRHCEIAKTLVDNQAYGYQTLNAQLQAELAKIEGERK